MPFTMMALRLAIARRGRSGWAVRAVVAWKAAGLIWLTLLDIAPWMAHVAILVVSVAALKRRPPAPQSA